MSIILNDGQFYLVLLIAVLLFLIAVKLGEYTGRK